MLLEKRRVDDLRLNGGMDAGAARRNARFDGLGKLAGVIEAPRIQHRRGFRQRLAVPLVQPRPVLLQRRSIVKRTHLSG